jgi:hypothetical protein
MQLGLSEQAPFTSEIMRLILTALPMILILKIQPLYGEKVVGSLWVLRPPPPPQGMLTG